VKCKFCDYPCQKAGRQKNGAQKLYCKGCNKYQQSVYRNKACLRETKQLISTLICESVSIWGIARILKISTNTVQAHLSWVGKQISKPPIALNQAIIEMDELHTFIGHKQNPYWIAYALNRATGKVLDFVIGKRSKRTLRMLVNTLLLSGARKICTDRLPSEPSRGPIQSATYQDGNYPANILSRSSRLKQPLLFINFASSHFLANFVHFRSK
jgi:transposase-like protein